MILSLLAGVISMFVDNVVTILMMAPVALPLARALAIPVFPLVLMIGLAANFMGSALIIGDLPPQMLHSVAGAEFFDFIWHQGRPSSFPILMVTFVATLGIHVVVRLPQGRAAQVRRRSRRRPRHIPDKLFATIAVGMFLLTVVGMSMREHLGVQLGLIAMTGAVITVLILEVLGKRTIAPRFEEIIQELDWRAIFFYIALFALVGGLEKTHVLEILANAIKPLFAENYALGVTLLYWVTIPIVGPRRARRLHPDVPLHDPRPGPGRHRAVAALLDAAVVRHARQQPDGRRRAGALRRAVDRREGGEPQGVAEGVPRVERAVRAGVELHLLRARHADLGAAVREMRRMAMFKHFLIPTDGSPLSTEAAEAGVKLAKALGARVTGFFAAPAPTPVIYSHFLPVGYMPPEEHARMIEDTAQQYLSVIENAARAAGVPCEVLHETNDFPADAIIETAREKGCDAIFISSHGHRGRRRTDARQRNAESREPRNDTGGHLSGRGGQALAARIRPRSHLARSPHRIRVSLAPARPESAQGCTRLSGAARA